MKTKILLPILGLLFLFNFHLQSQEPVVIFTAIDSADRVQLDSVKIINITVENDWGECDTTLYYPDTILYLPVVGLPGIQNNQTNFKVFQNRPNPAEGKTEITLYIPEKDGVHILITDIAGRKLIQYDKVLEAGYHSFLFTTGNENVYFFTARWKGNFSGIKILNASAGKQENCRLAYAGNTGPVSTRKSTRNRSDFVFTPGDILLFVGYTDTLQSGIENSPGPGDLYTFQFAHNIPCPGTPTVEYEGRTYNTIQIFSQCWMKENLNVGTTINGLDDMSDNDTIEKYCYQNDETNCDSLGGLYQWDEMMQYVTNEGAQGICPPGWHIPTDADWKILSGAADSQYGIGDHEWNGSYQTGYDVGYNLKSVDGGWPAGGEGCDKYGFTALPGGYRETNGNFGHYSGRWWTSTVIVDDYSSWARLLNYEDDINRHDGDNTLGYSVRCIRDEEVEK